ncbi:hypothetical protein THRCLA_07499 [Thraustotheca clavata]|uniref:C2H2-type domain-containing protein n=1 Tax=Thraustotheca clavata TaxID=74557 RepID=A0A1V9ZD07_9STRA|nr:hypothetical protein THRCLA_07499 [Thraustotheca clavata]
MDFVDANAADFFASLNTFTEPEPQPKKIKPSYTAQPKARVPDAKELALPMEERITNLLVPDMKVNDIIQLIKKMKQAGKSDADEFSEADAEINAAPRFVCDVCGNSEQNNFITDYARGDTICTGADGHGCGNVVQDHIVHEGNAYRKFEGEEDKSHHGPAPNKLFSTGHNLRTMISQDGEQSANLRRAAEFVEMNLSQMGKDERRTRIGYKDQMKQKAIRLIDHTGANLDLHEIVCNRAKKMFAEFRDLREHVHQFEAVVAGCIIDAYLTTGKEMYSAQASIKLGPKRQAGIAQIQLPSHKAIDEKKLHPFSCSKCGEIFNSKRGLQFHKCGDEDDSKKTDSTTNKVDLKPVEVPDEVAPVREIIDNKEWFRCPMCQHVYKKLEDATVHMERHKKQSLKRKRHIETSTMDTTRLLKTNSLASANPSVQVNTHESVLFRGVGRRPWLKHIQEEIEKNQKGQEETKL